MISGFFLLLASASSISCECRKSFMTICDSFEDVKKSTDKREWTELVIGSEQSTPNQTINLMLEVQFHQLPKLTTLMIVNKIDQLANLQTAECYHELKFFTLFALYGNSLKDFKFNQLPYIKAIKLSLVNNKIETLGQRALERHRLEILDLSDNYLEEISNTHLPKNEMTKIITINNNKLTHIEPQSFPSSLIGLNLDGNNLRFLQDGVLENLQNLQELTLSRNKFKLVPSIAHMEKLVDFDISSNSISSIDGEMFAKLNNLKNLDLSENSIQKSDVLASLLRPNRRPMTISLAFNELSSLDLVNVTLMLGDQVYLYGNYWRCKKWDDMFQKLYSHLTPCEKTFISSGVAPNCIKWEFYAPNQPYKEGFEYVSQTYNSAVRNGIKSFGCSLALNNSRYYNLYVQRSQCNA